MSAAEFRVVGSLACELDYAAVGLVERACSSLPAG